MTLFKLVSISAGLPKVLSRSPVSALVVEEYVNGGWLFGMTTLAAPLPFLALPFGGIVEVAKEEQERKNTS